MENLKCHICALLEIDTDADLVKEVGEQLLPLCEECASVVQDLEEKKEVGWR